MKKIKNIEIFIFLTSSVSSGILIKNIKAGKSSMESCPRFGFLNWDQSIFKEALFHWNQVFFHKGNFLELNFGSQTTWTSYSIFVGLFKVWRRVQVGILFFLKMFEIWETKTKWKLVRPICFKWQSERLNFHPPSEKKRARNPTNLIVDFPHSWK